MDLCVADLTVFGGDETEEDRRNALGISGKKKAAPSQVSAIRQRDPSADTDFK